MEGRTRGCDRCGAVLLIPPEVKNFRCAVCGSVSSVRSPGRGWNRAIDAFGPVNHPRISPSNNLNVCIARPSTLIPPSNGKKRALLCGINYIGKTHPLKGSINDAKCMNYLLTESLGFRSENILMLTDDETDPSKLPTKLNIQKAMRWLVQGCEPGDSLVFFFSGHGQSQKDQDGDELDGFDEALCPLDYESSGFIIDDEINATIVRPLPRGVVLHAIIDACYSGTMLDLPFLCRVNREGFYVWEDHRSPFTTIYKGTSGGVAICISACDDHQTSIDTNAFTKSKTRTGALTYSFIQALQDEPGLTYGRLLNVMRSAIREAHDRLRPNGKFAALVNRFFAPPQKPQLSSSEPFDIYTKKIVL